MPEKKGIIPTVQINQIKKIRRYIVDIKDILEKCDHTLLRVDCTSDEIRKLCDQAIKYNCASVCICLLYTSPSPSAPSSASPTAT